jgi:recombination protein RecT
MALKTVLKQLVSKWGIMSVELQQVFQADQAVIDNGKYVYVDNDGVVEEKKDKTPTIKNRLTPPKAKTETEVEVVEPDAEVDKAI